VRLGSPERIRTAATALRGRYSPPLAAVGTRVSPCFKGHSTVDGVGCRGPPADVPLPRCCPTVIEKRARPVLGTPSRALDHLPDVTREMTQVPTQPLSPAEHYAAAERLVAAAESSITDQIQTVSALIALTHAILTLSPRKARRVERQPRHASNGLPPHLTWGDES